MLSAAIACWVQVCACVIYIQVVSSKIHEQNTLTINSMRNCGCLLVMNRITYESGFNNTTTTTIAVHSRTHFGSKIHINCFHIEYLWFIAVRFQIGMHGQKETIKYGRHPLCVCVCVFGSRFYHFAKRISKPQFRVAGGIISENAIQFPYSWNGINACPMSHDQNKRDNNKINPKIKSSTTKLARPFNCCLIVQTNHSIGGIGVVARKSSVCCLKINMLIGLM